MIVYTLYRVIVYTLYRVIVYTLYRVIVYIFQGRHGVCPYKAAPTLTPGGRGNPLWLPALMAYMRLLL